MEENNTVFLRPTFFGKICIWLAVQKYAPNVRSRLKSNGLYLGPSKSSHNPVVVMKFEIWAHSARLLRKLDHLCFEY